MLETKDIDDVGSDELSAVTLLECKRGVVAGTAVAEAERLEVGDDAASAANSTVTILVPSATGWSSTEVSSGTQT